METSDMRKMTLWLRHEQLDKLQAISEHSGAPIAELIRRAIQAWLDARTKRGDRK